MGILNKTKCYLVGSMQYKNGREWRDEFQEKVKKLGITCFNPYSKPFVKDIQECENFQKNLLSNLEKENYDFVSEKMKEVRSFDLSLVDYSSFIVAYIDPTVVTVGSWEELFWANRLKKPIFLIIEGGKKKSPLWILGTLPHKYIYDDIDKVVDILSKIDKGEKELDNNRWRLLREEYR